MGEREELLDDSYYFRTDDVPSVTNKGEEIAHEIGFEAEGKYHLFKVVLFDSLLFEVEVWGKIWMSVALPMTTGSSGKSTYGTESTLSPVVKNV